MRLASPRTIVSSAFERVVARVTRDDSLFRRVDHRHAPEAVNLGGGPTFSALGWRNLDESAVEDEDAFKFSPDCQIPLADASLHTVYSSHTIEHLDDPTVHRLLAEARRILRPGGRLVIKIPDFDRALESWRSNDASFFRDDLWNFSAAACTWPSRGIDDTLPRRASMIFCGFWNKEHGNPFSAHNNTHPRAYHGPALVSEQELESLTVDRTPNEISRYLSQSVQRNETAFNFNHQNAWGRAELSELLRRAGFDVITTDKRVITVCCADIPDICSMYEQSSYTVATVRNRT